MNSFASRREYVETCLAKAESSPRTREVWLKAARRVAADIRFFAQARKNDGAPYPSWAIDFGQDI